MVPFSGPSPSSLPQLLEAVELRQACSVCSERKHEVTYVLRPEQQHNCGRQLLLGRLKKERNGKMWHEIRRRPKFPVPARYAVCWHYQPLVGCIRHGQNCTFAWSEEERLVWAFKKSFDLDKKQLSDMLFPSLPIRTESSALNSLDSILKHFGGQFQEVCEQCFYESPQRLTLSHSCHIHPRPLPLLTHIAIVGSRQQCHAILPLPHWQSIHLCKQSSRGLLCRVEGGHCPHAHSEVELAVWTAERHFCLRRGQIVQRSDLDMGLHCRLCLVTAPTQESFEIHCSTLEHRRIMADKTPTLWNHRTPPIESNDFAMCKSPTDCVYGNSCPKAHSKEELEEWILRLKISKKNKHVAELEGLQSYQDRLMEEYQRYNAEMPVLSEDIADFNGVRMSCDISLKVHIPVKPARTTWTFTLHSKTILLHVALLKTDPGVSFSLLAPDLPKNCHYAQGTMFKVKRTRSIQYTIKVLVEGSIYGLFEQWLVIDFGERPVLLNKIFLQVGGHNNMLITENDLSRQDKGMAQSGERWYPDEKLCIPCVERTDEVKRLMELHKLPKMNLNYWNASTKKDSLTTQNYKGHMHEWLFQEEAARETILSRLTLKVTMTLKKMVTSSMGMKVAPGGGLFADVPLPLGLTKDTEEGYLLFRSVKTALIAPCPPQGDKVYEVLVETESGLESSMWLEIPERCCQDLGLQDQASPLMEIQFQLERLDFCFYHEAVDRLQDPSLVLPDLAKCRVPTVKQSLSWGNTKQQMAASYIIGSVPEKNLVAPLLIYGPFGTGKTYTIAKTTLEVIKQTGSRVLICTHNNSTADLYIREYFHPHVLLGHPEAIPLRVKYQLSPINRTDEITLQYCALAEDNLSFSTPQRGKLDQHQIIVTTAATSRDLNVPRGYFTHIFLDETAQMLESEALIPLTLADHRTRILMAGDHMQETPRLFSQALASCHEELTLLTRLFSYYQCRDCAAANGARIIFHQNYRSVPAIISFISKCFYVGRDDAIEACAGGAESPKDRYALALFHVRGPSTKDGNSWVNQSEVLQVLEVVKDVLRHWPESWGPVKRDKICVVSQGSQVQLIRQELRKIRHRDITVTSYDNIIGCEYQVIILSVVRSLESLPSTSPMSSNFSLEIFCNPRVLNTILTRARSQIIVVGDMVALCSFGGCSRIWRRYVRECVEKGTASPPDLSVEEIRQVVYSQHFWTEQQENDEDLEDSDSWSSDPDINSEDLILQELLRGTKAFVTVSEEGILEISSGGYAESREGKYKNFPTYQLEQYLLKQPNIYKKCQLIKDSFDSGCAVTLHEIPPKRIQIKGRLNLGMAFSGDQVVVKLHDTNSQEGKVVGVLNPGENVRRYVCYMEPYDNSIMVPIDKSVTKIYCHRFKEKPGFVPIRSFENGRVKNIGFAKLTHEMKQDQLFLVQVIKWDQGFYYPLGIVICILPKISTEELGLQVLDLEYGVAASREYPEKASREAEELSSNIPFTEERLDCRDILTFTIDPLNAKDLDDAISVRDLQDHYEIGVHITDLTPYVRPGGELDTEARSRGVTFYCPKSDPVHMLPFRLSSDLCSLKSQCDRRAVSLFVLVQKSTDQMVEGQFCQTLIRSDRQLSYEEANSILNAQQGRALAFNSLEDCVGVVWHFSKVHCRCRLQDAAIYKQPDEHCSTGVRSAQRMIEELMIMYNNWVAEYLCEKESLNHVVPLRCQAHPGIEKLEMVRDKIKHLLPLSSYLSHHLLDDPAHGYPSHDLKITILSSIWEQLQSAAQKEDFIRVMDILYTDDLHPELCDAARKFRKSLGRSYLKRSASPGPNEHYSLQLCTYTWASSPIRRYLDIVVQRLLHSSLRNKEPKMDAQNIDMLCHEFEMQVHQESVYEKKSHALCLALSFQNQVQKKMSVVVSAEPHSNGLQVVFPLNGDSLSSPLDVLYSMLQPSEQPQETIGGTQLSWRRRVYSHHFFRDLPALGFYQDIVAFSGKAWQDALSALRQSKPEEVLSILKKGIEEVDAENTTKRSSCGHYVELTLDLRPGKSFFIQLCTTLKRGLPTPSPQLFFPSPAIQLCLEHTDRPIECFSKLANRGPLTIYKNEAEYVRLWLPLCDMEAVVSAVSEGGGVLLRDVPVRWENKNTTLESVGMKGSFKLSENLIDECDLDMDFRHCYLCIRMEELRANSSPGELDSQIYTWVAHGLTDKDSEKKTDSDKKHYTVTFHIHQATMKHAPEEAFKSAALFTLEIIPKLLPDIRKEFAVKLLKSASELAKNIALGKRIPDRVINRKFKSQNSFNIPGYRGLNLSQTKAVKAAVTQPFTVIQGPPGTGKTVVGVHIVHWFHHINQELNLQVEEEKEEEEKDKSVEQNEEECSRRRVIMYCGPSNKSVDVVAEMLLPLRDKLRPLRVYSEQIELTEFPYPGSGLRMSGYLREGRPNPSLRSITLHHRIRQPPNRHHHAILAMDRRIQNKENITPEEIKEYKKTVYKARLVELECHDVVLCTCVAASSLSLTKLRVSQLIVDESAMCTEPEVLVPLVNHKHLDSVVLIGDHRQLRPVILNNMCRLLKMDHSLFERYQQRALMLDTQYRMHYDICEFPSKEFYEGRLITSDQLHLRPSLFYQQSKKICPFVFGEVKGKEKSLNVTTEEGNINSKANTEEAEEAIRLARCLVQESVEPSDIAILSPYNAQVTLITKKLQEQNLSGVTVCTIMKSQGSEWRYVIFSTVRTMPENEVDKRPTISWTRRHLGFLSDPNQINVALTRPKEGLCVLGVKK
uniref:Helicase with zinc finger 2 n=1 Tax=Leptobrachium leishanense TaxID=445787 RepID=A0A8C5MKQ9_9ANUR